MKLRSRTLAATFVAAALTAAGLLAGCGGSSGSATGTEASATVATGSGSGQIVASHDKVTKSEETVISTGQFPTGRDTDEESTSGTPPIKPCALVTRKEARTILGGTVTMEEHPQGPTCVIASSGREITMAVMELPLKPLVSGARKSTPLTIRGHQAYCLRYEKTSVVTAIGGGRILQVTGPCQADVRFVSAALPRIPR